MSKISVKIAGQKYDGWRAISVSKSLGMVCASFSIDVSDRWQSDKQNWVFKPGASLDIFINDQRFMRGYVDQLSCRLSTDGRNMQVEGREITADLIDCSVTEKFEYVNISLLNLAESVSKPFGIEVISFGELGDKFSRWSIKQGETVFETLERAARLRGVLITTNGDGVLVLSKPQVVPILDRIAVGENVLSGESFFDYKNRYSKIVVKGSASATDENFGPKVSQVKGSAIDESIARFRPLILVADSNVDGGSARKRAEWEVVTRAAKASQITVTVQGWESKTAGLWAPAQLVNVDAEYLGVRSPMLIESVEYVLGINSGYVTNIKLARPDAFGEYTEIRKKKNEPVNFLGWGT